MLTAVLHLSTALPKPSAAALKPAAQMDATLVTKLNSGGWKGPTASELELEERDEWKRSWSETSDMGKLSDPASAEAHEWVEKPFADVTASAEYADMSEHLLSGKAVPPPHIFLMMSDDQGFIDMGYAGSQTVKTPFLDSLAKKATHFNNFRAETWCAPSRTAFMTGRYGWELGTNFPDTNLELSPDRLVMVSSVLRDAGYHTALVGKWHVTSPEACQDRDWGQVAHYNITAAKIGNQPIPLQPGPKDFHALRGKTGGFGCGFDDAYGFMGGESGYYQHSKHMQRNGEPHDDKGYLTDLFADEAASVVKKHKKERGSQPLFLWMALNAPHPPFEAPANVISKFTEADLIKAAGGESQNSKDNYYAFRKPGSEGLAHMRVYLAMIYIMDKAFHQVADAMSSAGMWTNTLSVFMSDNGGPNGFAICNGGLRGTKATPFDGGTRVPFFVHWPSALGSKARHTNAPGHIADLLATFYDVAKGGITDAKVRGELNSKVSKFASQSRSLLSSLGRAKAATELLGMSADRADLAALGKLPERESNTSALAALAGSGGNIVLQASATSGSVVDADNRWKLVMVGKTCLREGSKKGVNIKNNVPGLDPWVNIAPSSIHSPGNVLVQLFDLHNDPMELTDLLGHGAEASGSAQSKAASLLATYLAAVKQGKVLAKAAKATGDNRKGKDRSVAMYNCLHTAEAWEPDVWDETMKDGNCAARNEAEHRQVRVFPDADAEAQSDESKDDEANHVPSPPPAPPPLPPPPKKA